MFWHNPCYTYFDEYCINFIGVLFISYQHFQEMLNVSMCDSPSKRICSRICVEIFVFVTCRYAAHQTVWWLVVKCCPKWTSTLIVAMISTATPVSRLSMMSPSHQVTLATPHSVVSLNTEQLQDCERFVNGLYNVL